MAYEACMCGMLTIWPVNTHAKPTWYVGKLSTYSAQFADLGTVWAIVGFVECN